MDHFDTIRSFPTVQSCGFNTCSKCELTDAEFTRLIDDKNALLQFLIKHGVVSCHTVCPKCDKRLKLKEVGNQWRYDCRRLSYKGNRRRQCSFRDTALRGTFFNHSRIPIVQACTLVTIYLSRNAPRVYYAHRETGLSTRTVVDWFSFIREVLIDWVYRRSAKLGGPGKIVEIDEAKLGKRKYNRGRLLRGQWVLGGIERGERGSNPGKMFLIPVPDRSAETLVNVIVNNVLPGSTIITDGWRSYNLLSQHDYRHLTVNHELNFVDARTGAHTQNIERSWVEVRRHVPRAGLVKNHLASYLADSIFRRVVPDHRLRRHCFWQAVAQLYPPVEHPLR
ncbi:uncharacterized protein LOC108737443 [Agrilus planipennis]|uniref:Uncharacterized protein LOC108737443 n=1 Tax=Agrilus planipennis TaxID=224129 RepID=A0A1W4WPE3_AGRPL|nr:uncharacterized protein LOC108737443 [Agrilus planipennis]XP_018325791.1 uncharacterized protein LOC108737443 [Agrilus planipennis]